MQKWIVQGLVPILCGMALLLGMVAAGRAARVSLHDRADYSLAFADIDCRPPEGMSRAAFLNEVRSLASQPAALHLLDEDLSAGLHRAFLAHPWVESVRRVAIDPLASASRRAKTSVRIEMEYRRAVLAISTADGKKRMVDHYGILLPESAPPGHLPVLISEVAAPAGTPGSHWGDARVAAAARTVALLHPHLTQLHLEGSQMEMVEGEIVFRRPGVRIVWGHAPGHETEGEAPALVKLRRLLDYQKEHDGLDSLEHDVRLLAYQGHFPLPPDEPRSAVSFYESSQSPASRNREQISNSSRSWRSCFNDVKPPSANDSSR
ncbi:MAG TPA: hypothetical protein VMF69_27975 [Gemmataceae bacterium]|nr:hypothetical protein [Gemmataceae bacterium]